MSWLTKLFSAGVSEAVEKVGNVATKFAEGHLGKKEFALEVRKLLHDQQMAVEQRISSEIALKERVMVAELQQGDSYTKRARPTIIYVGLVAAIVDAIGGIDFTMQPDFWYVWGGVAGIYMVGRSAEKVGVKNKVVSAVTGSRLLDT